MSIVEYKLANENGKCDCGSRQTRTWSKAYVEANKLENTIEIECSNCGKKLKLNAVKSDK